MKTNEDSLRPDGKPEIAHEEVKTFKYMCYGCTNEAGRFDKVKAGTGIVCKRCGMAQNTKAENYILIV